MDLEFDIDYLNKSYKLIWEKLMSDGITIPYLIKENIDEAYYLSLEDYLQLSRKLSKIQHQRLSDAYYNRRLKEKEIRDSTKSSTKKIKLFSEYKEDEIIEFIKNYPEFKSIIK
jgi:hypothetical protein